MEKYPEKIKQQKVLKAITFADIFAKYPHIGIVEFSILDFKKFHGYLENYPEKIKQQKELKAIPFR